MLMISAFSQAGYSPKSVRKVQRRSSQESLMTFEEMFQNQRPFLDTNSFKLVLTLFSLFVITFQSSSYTIILSFSKMFSKLMIYNQLKLSHYPEIFLREWMTQRLNQSPWMISFWNVFLICGWSCCPFMQFLILLLTYYMMVQMSLNRYSFRQKAVFPVLLKASSKMRQESSSLDSPSSFFYQNYSILVMDLLTKIKLFLKSSMLVISFFLSALTAFTILGCSKSSFQLMRPQWSLHSIFLMSSTRSSERL